jgi:2-amino-4-hydroxy-6-hydroxymethyldihydropteridine diphosphokinase
MTVGYISVGSNIDKETNISSSLKALGNQFGDLQISSIYETEAVGFEGDSFYNLIVRFESALTAKEVAKTLRQIELDHGRSRESQKFSPRTLDLDLILFGDQIINDGRLQIPRDEILHYAFVLEPLAEIAGDAIHPLNGQSYRELWRGFDKQDLQRKIVSLAE